MTASMVRAARQWMDVVLPDSFLEHFPSEPMDSVVLCNVLEPYPPEVRRLLFAHATDFLGPKGRIIVVIATKSGLGRSAECGLDLVFPTPCEGGTSPEVIEEDMTMSGLDVSKIELVESRTLDHARSMPGEQPRTERRTYAVVTARKAD
eukprot:UN4027